MHFACIFELDELVQSHVKLEETQKFSSEWIIKCYIGLLFAGVKKGVVHAKINNIKIFDLKDIK